MTIPRVTDHAEQGLARLIQQYQGKPRIRGWLLSYLDEAQEISDQIYLTTLSRLIDHAAGVHLDVIGKIVGQPRREGDDERYRVLLRARVAVNVSDGTVGDLQRVASLVLGGPDFSIDEVFPASVVVDSSAPIDFADIAFELIEQAKSAGVALTLHHYDGHDEDETLVWSDGDGFEDDEDRGFGGDDPDSGSGGYLIGAY